MERFLLSTNEVGYLNLINGSVFVDDTYRSSSFCDYFLKCSDIEKESLKKMGFILDKSEISFVEGYLNFLKKEVENDIPGGIEVILGFECNFGCPYCAAGVGGINTRKLATNSLDLKKTFRLIKNNPSLLEAIRKQLSFFGGEPLFNTTLRKREINYIFEQAIKLSVRRITIPTNGYSINHYLKEFKRITDKKIELSLQVTLDGSEKIHNLTRKLKNGQKTFEAIITNVSRLLKMNNSIQVKIRTNISSFNKNHLKEYILFLKKECPDWINHPRIEFQFVPIIDEHFSNTDQNNISDVELYEFLIFLFKQGIRNVRTHPMLDFLLNSMQGKTVMPPKIRCKKIVFGPDNNIYSCSLCDKDTLVGDVNSGVNKSKILKLWKGQKYNIPKCKSCKYVFLCNGGDRLAAIRKTGRPDSPVCECSRKNFSLFYKILLEQNKQSV